MYNMFIEASTKFGKKQNKDHNKMKKPFTQKKLNSSGKNSTISRILCENNAMFSSNRSFRKAIEAIKLNKTQVTRNKLLLVLGFIILYF